MDEPEQVVKPRRGKSVGWRRDPVILARLPLVEERHLRGAYHTSIAAELGISEATVRADLKRLNELWLERAKDELDDLRAQRFAELEAVKRMALRSFDFDMEALSAVLYNESLDGKSLAEKSIDEHSEADRDTVPQRGRRVYRDVDGRAQYKADKVAALQVYRQATMDQAKLYGLVIEKRDLTSGGEAIKAYIGIDLDAV